MGFASLEKLNKNLLITENLLSYCAAIPVCGILPGAIKVGMGIVQTVASLAFSILFILPSIFVKLHNSKNDTFQEIYKFLGDQLLNGMANVVAGCLESIPFVGLIGQCCLREDFLSIDAMGSNRGKIIQYSYVSNFLV